MDRKKTLEEELSTVSILTLKFFDLQTAYAAMRDLATPVRAGMRARRWPADYLGHIFGVSVLLWHPHSLL